MPAARVGAWGDNEPVDHPEDPLAAFGPHTRAWFTGAFEAPTPAQTGAWRAVAADRHALIVAPTGSGKTLAAFLWSIDHLSAAPPPAEPAMRCRIVYISPLKALAADVERNLRSPLAGIRQAAARAGGSTQHIEVGMRTGDTPPAERRRFATHPPDILITTPESLFLILTSNARAGLSGVDTVIVDEIHAVAGTKRGTHLAVSLERLDALLVAGGRRPARRIGLSATVRPVDAVAAFLTGHRAPAEGGREVDVVQPPTTKQVDVDVVVPVPDLADLGTADPIPGKGSPASEDAPRRRASVWPHVEARVVDLVADHRSTLVFTNSRRGAERLTARMNEIWAERLGLQVPDPQSVVTSQVTAQSGNAAGTEVALARAHHGSMSRSERTRTETELKEGRLPAVVATSSLELGIDMGAVDLVVQVGSPPSVASGLQRVGRAGHQVGAVSRGVVFPTHRGDLIPSAVAASRMRAGQIEELHIPANPLDVLAQQIVAMLAIEPSTVADLAATVRRAAPFARLGDATLTAVLDMLAGRYPSEDFGELRARIVWDRATGTLTGRPGGLRLATTSGGTIPDRGLYGVFLASSSPSLAAEDQVDSKARPRGGKRVGELDEEMVYESRVGDTFTLGSSTWRIEEITPDRVLVSPAPGIPGRLPFWKGDSPGRPAELGRAVGAWTREVGEHARKDPAAARAILTAGGLDEWAADNLLAYLAEQRVATGRVPDDKTVVVERFRDELGDWRIVVHSPYGARVHAPWALVLAERMRERYGLDAACMHADDGIVLRLPDLSEWGEDGSDVAVSVEDLLIDPDDVLGAVRTALGSSVMFAARFREAAARALLLPRRRPDRRQPLWQQRHRSAQLLAVASQYPEFPIVLEAVRECLSDDFEVAALTELMRDLGTGRIRLLETTTPGPSPFAQSLLFGYTAQFLYDGDAPLAERRAAALSLDPQLLAELLGGDGVSGELADLLDPAAIEHTEAELGRYADDRRARTAEHVWDLLRRLGPLPASEVARRCAEGSPVESWLAELHDARRIIAVRLAGVTSADQWAVIEDAGRLRDALGVALPVGIPEVFTEPTSDPLGDLIRRHARTHGPFTTEEVATRFGLGTAVVAAVADRLTTAGFLVRGRLRPEAIGGCGDDWCDADVLRTLRRRSLAALRAEVEPVPGPALGVFLPRWHGLGEGRGSESVLRAVELLSGLPLPASTWETLILPARVDDYDPGMLDELTTSGEILWCGHSGGEGLVSLHLTEWAPLTLPEPTVVDGEVEKAVLAVLTGSGGHFLPQLVAATAASPDEVVDALWTLVWAGQVTNDGFGPVRAKVSGAHRAPRPTPVARPMRARLPGWGSAGITRAVRTPPRPDGAGRWSALPELDLDPTRRAHTLARVLLGRHGVLTRAVAPVEGVGAQFRSVYRVLAEAEATGSVRRGYFVEHLGGSQFALPGAVDLLRTAAQDRERAAESTAPAAAVLLASTDPANPYGAALTWPDPLPQPDARVHRPGRKPGALVVLIDGDLALYVERGGRTVLTFTSGERLSAACQRLAEHARSSASGRWVIARIDGVDALSGAGSPTPHPSTAAFLRAGFRPTPRGLRA